MWTQAQIHSWIQPVLRKAKRVTFLVPILRTTNSQDYQFSGLPILRTTNSQDYQFSGLSILRTTNSQDYQFSWLPILSTTNSQHFDVYNINLKMWRRKCYPFTKYIVHFPHLPRSQQQLKTNFKTTYPYHHIWDMVTITHALPETV